MKHYDVIVVGSGPAGCGAACAASDQGATVAIIEREQRSGGILKQCIHDGFGLKRYKEQLTGPEYAYKDRIDLEKRPITTFFSSFITKLEQGEDLFILTLISPHGIKQIKGSSLIMATGCRERTDRQIFIQGERPAGVFTAGQAQNLINIQGHLPGKKCLILGSGDIGLIMARRLTLEGAKVLGVYEIGKNPSGLNRNIAQCLEDYNIPLYLQTTVLNLYGKQRLEGVSIAKVDNRGQIIANSQKKIKCDTLILSVGLIPENDLLYPLGVKIDPLTKGPLVDQFYETSVKGLYSCGNALTVFDLVDYVSLSGEQAGKAAALRALKIKKSNCIFTSPIKVEGPFLSVIPQKINLEKDPNFTLFFRSKKVMEKAVLEIYQEGLLINKKNYTWLKPSEMSTFTLKGSPLIQNDRPLTILLREKEQ